MSLSFRIFFRFAEQVDIRFIDSSVSMSDSVDPFLAPELIQRERAASQTPDDSAILAAFEVFIRPVEDDSREGNKKGEEQKEGGMEDDASREGRKEQKGQGGKKEGTIEQGQGGEDDGENRDNEKEPSEKEQKDGDVGASGALEDPANAPANRLPTEVQARKTRSTTRNANQVQAPVVEASSGTSKPTSTRTTKPTSTRTSTRTTNTASYGTGNGTGNKKTKAKNPSRPSRGASGPTASLTAPLSSSLPASLPAPLPTLLPTLLPALLPALLTAPLSSSLTASLPASLTASLMGDTGGDLLVEDLGFAGSLQWVTARCGDSYGPGYHHAVTSAVEGVSGYLKRPPLQHHLTTTGTLLARMSEAIQSLADHALSSGNTSGRATSRSGAAWRDRAFPGHHRRHVLVFNVTGHAHTDSFKRGFEANLVMSETDHVPFTDLVRHVGARLAEARAKLVCLAPSVPAASASLATVEVVLDISSCFVPQACIETAMELKRLSASSPGVHVILPCDLVTQPDAIGFNMGFHAKLLEGASVRDAALYAGQHNHFSSRGIVLFSGGERFDVRPLFPWGSSRASRPFLPFLPGKRKRPQEEDGEEKIYGEGEGEDEKEEKVFPASTMATSTAIPFADLDAVLPGTPILNNPNFSNLQLNPKNLTALQLADLEAMGFSMVTNGTEFQDGGPRPDPQRSKALVALRERLGAEAAIYALGPVPVGSKYAASGPGLLARRTTDLGTPVLPGPWDRGCLFSRSERQQISNLDGLSGPERKRHKRHKRPNLTAQGGTAHGGPDATNVLGRTNGCAFCKHGLVSVQGLARLYPRIKAYLCKTPF